MLLLLLLPTTTTTTQLLLTPLPSNQRALEQQRDLQMTKARQMDTVFKRTGLAVIEASH